MRLLLIEDNERFAALLRQGLATAGFTVDVLTTAKDASAALETGRWDIVVELRADSLEAFDRVLARIRLVEGISQSETSLLLSTFK